MSKIWKIFEYGYLAIAVVFFYETIQTWNNDRSRAYMLLLFAVVAIFMYFFRKRFRSRFEKRNKQ